MKITRDEKSVTLRGENTLIVISEAPYVGGTASVDIIIGKEWKCIGITKEGKIQNVK